MKKRNLIGDGPRLLEQLMEDLRFEEQQYEKKFHVEK